MSDTNKYPYFARTKESTALRNPAMIRVLRHYNWSKVAIISQNLDYVLAVREVRLFPVYYIWNPVLLQLKPVRCKYLYKVRIGFIDYNCITCCFQASDDLKNLLKNENITLLSAITFDDSPDQVIRQIKVS